MADAVLVFPYFDDGRSRSFKFPPLGIGYIASYLKTHGLNPEIVDCTFLTWEKALGKIKNAKPRVVGVYSMLSMVEEALRFANELRGQCDFLVAGGPMPSAYPQKFLGAFDAVAIGDAEETMAELVSALEEGRTLDEVKGLHLSRKAIREYAATTSYANGGSSFFSGQRPLNKNLDALPFPARELYDNGAYREYYQKNYGYTMTSMIASRGCPFCCDFCFRPEYGRYYRVRSPENIVDEMEEIVHRFGYSRIWFADELFIASKKHVISICEEIINRKLEVKWECLARADIVDERVANAMEKAGCHKIIFGFESGDDRVLKLMNKKITVAQSRNAARVVSKSGIKVGGFFILGYPGETNETILNTVRFIASLPLDYFSMTVPYPLPGTGLYERVKDRMIADEWQKPLHGYDHKLLFKHDFTIKKLEYAMHKAIIQSKLKKKLGPAYVLLKPWEWYTDHKFRKMN